MEVFPRRFASTQWKLFGFKRQDFSMRLHSIVLLLVIVTIAGCMGASGLKKETKAPSRGDGGYEASAASGPGKGAWKNADRCTMCHMVWSWEYGYYRGWDRHGFISDYTKLAPVGYKDPWGLDVPVNTFREYYYTAW
jgi:hypothetical protein